MSYLQAIIMGLIQGVSELFPVSSLGHSVLLPSLLGWHNIVVSQSAKNSFFVAFLVGLHVATALALAWFFKEDWARIVRAFLHTLKTRRLATADERLAWLLIAATIPACIVGALFASKLQELFAKPLAAAVFLMINGVILLTAERLRRKGAHTHKPVVKSRQLDNLEFKEAGIIGVAQVFSLLAGISRSGITMVAGLVRGLDHEDAARFSFLLATPVILAAGVYKLPSLMGPDGAGVRGQILAGSVAAALAAYISVRFLTRYFKTKTLTPFAVYCLIFGALMVLKFTFF